LNCLLTGNLSQAQWFTPVIPAFGRLRQEDHELEASLDYTARHRKFSDLKKI
jgi:hypothetical protein